MSFYFIVVISDIDECAEGSDLCHENADCNNTMGNYTCRCHQGFIEDGFSCSSKSRFIV